MQVRYVGFYGRGVHPARVEGVGEVFFGQIVDIPFELFERIAKHEWELASDSCQHVNMDGDLCSGKHINGSHLCEFHREEFKQRAQLIGG